MPIDESPDASRRTLSACLDREWEVIRSRPRILARVRSWNLTDAPVADLDELLALAGYRTDSTPEANELLRRLLEIARTDELASRIVLQRLLPGLLAIVRRRRRTAGADGALEELIGAAWLSIQAYRTDRSSQRIAANLVRDAGYRAFTAPSRRRSSSEVAIDPRALDDTPAVVTVSAGEELARLLVEAREGGLPDEDLDLLLDLVHVGSPSLVAFERKVTPRTIRNHRDRAAAHVREIALAA